MKISVLNFPALKNFCSDSPETAFIIGFGSYYQPEFGGSQNAIFKKGWQPMEFANEKSIPQTPEVLQKLFNALQATGKSHIELVLAYDGGQQTVQSFRLKNLASE